MGLLKVNISSKTVNVELELSNTSTVKDLKALIYKRCTGSTFSHLARLETLAETAPLRFLGRGMFQTPSTTRTASGSTSMASVRRLGCPSHAHPHRPALTPSSGGALSSREGQEGRADRPQQPALRLCDQQCAYVVAVPSLACPSATVADSCRTVFSTGHCTVGLTFKDLGRCTGSDFPTLSRLVSTAPFFPPEALVFFDLPVFQFQLFSHALASCKHTPALRTPPALLHANPVDPAL